MKQEMSLDEFIRNLIEGNLLLSKLIEGTLSDTQQIISQVERQSEGQTEIRRELAEIKTHLARLPHFSQPFGLHFPPNGCGEAVKYSQPLNSGGPLKAGDWVWWSPYSQVWTDAAICPSNAALSVPCGQIKWLRETEDGDVDLVIEFITAELPETSP